MRLNETCNMIIEQEYIENVVFSQPDGLRACRRWRFSALTFIRSTKVYIPTKLSYEAQNRHFWQGAVTCWRSRH
jgi:hypothetical protein